MAELGHALCYLHGHGVVHGDLKQGNVLIAGEGHAVLMSASAMGVIVAGKCPVAFAGQFGISLEEPMQMKEV